MSDAGFHKLVFGSTIEEPQKTLPFSCRLEVDLFADIAAFADHFGTTRTFVVQTLLRSSILDLYRDLDTKNLAEIEGKAQGYADQLNEEK